MEETKTLTNKEVVLELRAMTKPYIGVIAQSLFSERCIKIEHDLCKPITVMKFFALFGYKGTWNSFTKSES